MAERDITVTFIDGKPESAEPARPAWRRVASSAVALAAAFAVGLGTGYELPRGDEPPPPQPTGSATGTATVVATGRQCAVPTEAGVRLGAELLNQGPDTAVLRGARIELPLGGLIQTDLVWGACGELGALQAHGPDKVWAGLVDLPADDRVWLSAAFELVDPEQCPAPYPVRLRAAYLDTSGRITEVEFGFVDLGDVPFAACER